MGVAAIAADIGRFYVVTGELQTSADAAALKGVAVLQMSSAANPATMVTDSVTAWVASTNRADGNPVATGDMDVTLGFWTPGQNGAVGTFETALGTRRANAVSVLVRRSPVGTFTQMIGRTAGLPLARQGIAWIGNVSLNCVRPFAFPYGPFYKRVNNLGAIPANPIPDLDPAAFAAYQKTSVANRTVVIIGRGETAPAGLPNDGNWEGYNLPNNNAGNSNASENTFTAQISSCGDIALNSDAGNGKTVPNNGNGQKCGANDKIVCAMVDAIDDPNGNGVITNCAPFRAGDAGCYASNSASLPGVQIDMAWGDFTGNGSGTVDFRYVAEFQLMCVFSSSAQTCGALTAPNNTGYPPGTVVGVTLGLKSRKLNPTDIISNSPSNVQRFFLVK